MEIVVRQFGGLGNQLFQYAAGRFYATQYSTGLRIATEVKQRSHSLGDRRDFLLSKFRITAPFREVTRLEMCVLAQHRRLKPLSSALARARRIQIFREAYTDRYRFKPNLTIEPNVHSLYMVGYWQVHAHVDEMGDHFRREFQLREQPQGKDLEVLQEIQQSQTPISIHIRRSDYIHYFGAGSILPPAYYRSAIRTMLDRLNSPRFFVFSDDIAFAKQHLPNDIRSVFVSHNDSRTAHEDLRLMSACGDHIIANSTFSWWGAWLNPSQSKIVIAPRQWLEPDIDYTDLIPNSWILVGDENRI